MKFATIFKSHNLIPRKQFMYLDKLTGTELTANINPHEHGFASKTQTLIPTNINEFTVHRKHLGCYTLQLRL